MAFSSLFDMTAADKALKELYSGQVIENLVYSDNPLLALMPKFTEFVGKNYPQPLIYGAPMGRSSTFATAQSTGTSGSQSAPLVTQFLLTRASDYAIGTLTNETMLASKSDKGAFLEGAKLVIDGVLRASSLSLASAMYRSGTGSIGQIGSISTGVITLSNAQDVVQFEIGMQLEARQTDGGTVRGTAGSNQGFVIAVDRSAGTVTVALTQGGAAATPSTGAAWTANDFLLVYGDSNAKVKGLDAWIPTTAPGSTAFFGVDRTADTVRLGGVRYDGSSQSIEEALIDASLLVAREGGKPTHCFMSFASYAALQKGLGAKVNYVDVNGPANIMFKGIEINGANSRITVLPDRNAQANRAFLLQLDTWKLRSLGDAPTILTYGDGLTWLRQATGDGSEVRAGYYAQVGTSAPGYNATVKLSA